MIPFFSQIFVFFTTHILFENTMRKNCAMTKKGTLLMFIFIVLFDLEIRIKKILKIVLRNVSLLWRKKITFVYFTAKVLKHYLVDLLVDKIDSVVRFNFDFVPLLCCYNVKKKAEILFLFLCHTSSQVQLLNQY